jgi:hypothetical protein
MKMSKRDLNIAKASLAVYPVSEAFLESRNPSHWVIYDHYHTIRIEASGTGSSEKIGGWYRCTDEEFGYDFNQNFSANTSRRFPDNSTKEVWMNNFALVALRLYDAKVYAKKAFILKKLLMKEKLCTRQCWALAVSRVIAKKRPKKLESVFKIGRSGILKSKPDLGRLGRDSSSPLAKSGMIDALIKLAKEFEPTTEPSSTNRGHFIGNTHIEWFADQSPGGVLICMSEQDIKNL